MLLLALAITAYGQTITADQVFSSSMEGQIWTFANSLGDETSIEVEPVPPSNLYPANCVVWSYAKSRSRAYWSPGAIGAILQFVLCPLTDGSWVSAGSVMQGTTGLGGQGAPWKVTQNVVQIPGDYPAYLIIPASGSATAITTNTAYQGYSLSGVETFNSVINDPSTTTRTVPWRSVVYTTNICVPYQNFCGQVLANSVFEMGNSNCDISTFQGVGCINEIYYFAPGLGMVQIDVVNQANVWLGFCALDPDVTQCYTLDQVSMKRTR